jgi:hypothetical protein
VARRTTTSLRSLHTSLLDAFRRQPAAFSAVARECSCDHRTAMRGWLEGWPQYNLAPIKDALAAAPAQAAAAATAPTAVVALPVPLAPEQRAYHEEKLSSDLLVVARQQVSVIGHLLGYSTKLAARIQQEAEHVQEIDPARALTLLNSVSRLVHKVETIGELAIRLERARMGDVPMVDVNVHVDEQVDANVVAQEARALLEALALEQRPEVAAAQTVAALPSATGAAS